MADGIAYYDLARNPPSFNFVDFLLRAEEWRRNNGLHRLILSVLPGPLDGFRKDCLPPSGKEERTKWLNNIVMPMPRLLPSCGKEADYDYIDGYLPEFGRGAYLVGFYSLMDLARKNIYALKASEDDVSAAVAKHGRYVTITLRNTGWWVKRTSNVTEWTKVAAELRRQRFKVIFIPDATKPDTVIDDFECDHTAAKNAVARAALYAGAEMNFGIPTGPMWMCWFMGAPAMVVKMLNEEEPSTRAASYQRSGLPPGSQIANARPRQRLVWSDNENADMVLREFECLMK